MKYKYGSYDRNLAFAQFTKLPADLNCQHSRDTHRRCWHHWLKAQVASTAFNEFSYVQWSNLLNQGHIRALAACLVYLKYLDAYIKVLLSSNLDFHFCLAPSCNSGRIHSAGKIYRRVSCEFKAPVRCNVAWHEGETSANSQLRNNRRAKDEEESAKAQGLFARLVPGYSREVEKNGSVYHIILASIEYFS